MPRCQITVPAGSRFGRLITLEAVVGSRASVLCLCDCGNEKIMTRVGRLGHAPPNIVSCGCARIGANPRTGKRSGKCNKPEYRVWSSMLTRCRNKNCAAYDRYGGRGIVVCDRWLRFEGFYEDMGPRPSLDHSIERIDNDGPYSLANCRWATALEQGRNKRNNHFVMLRGERRTLSEWAEISGICQSLIKARLKQGWLPEHAVFWPANHKNYHARIRQLAIDVEGESGCQLP